MMKMGKRALLVACGCMLLLSGCTKSNIVQPDASEAEEPDFNVYNNIELDMAQFHERTVPVEKMRQSMRMLFLRASTMRPLFRTTTTESPVRTPSVASSRTARRT